MFEPPQCLKPINKQNTSTVAKYAIAEHGPRQLGGRAARQPQQRDCVRAARTRRGDSAVTVTVFVLRNFGCEYFSVSKLFLFKTSINKYGYCVENYLEVFENNNKYIIFFYFLLRRLARVKGLSIFEISYNLDFTKTYYSVLRYKCFRPLTMLFVKLM